MNTILNAGVARLVDYAFTLALAGMEREPIVAQVRQWEQEGKTPDEITDALQAGRKDSEVQAQADIDNAPV